jgi:hypothetical protein
MLVTQDPNQTSGERYRAKLWRQQQRLAAVSLREAGCWKKGWWQPGRLPPTRLLTGRLVCATKLTCLLPNLLHFVLRPQTSERYVLDGT